MQLHASLLAEHISTKLVQTFNHAAIEGHANYTQLCGTVQQGGVNNTR